MSHMTNLRITVALTATAFALALAPGGAQAATVCNEAGNGHHGDLVATGTPDPSPPARFKSGLSVLGSGQSNAGLDNAANRSPALSTCALPETNGGLV